LGSFQTCTTSIQIRPYYFNLASFFVNCDFSEVGLFFRNLISDNESFMFWHSFAEISSQNFNPIYKSGRNMSINWSNLNRGCKSFNFQNKKFNWPVTSRFFTRHKRKKNFFLIGCFFCQSECKESTMLVFVFNQGESNCFEAWKES
jgi:hypothetical protein